MAEAPTKRGFGHASRSDPINGRRRGQSDKMRDVPPKPSFNSKRRLNDYEHNV